MKFTIEIYATNDGSESPLHRTAVSSITPLGARKEAKHLLSEWKRRGAKSVCVRNVQGEILYKLSE